MAERNHLKQIHGIAGVLGCNDEALEALNSH
jgi:hypothetical protein